MRLASICAVALAFAALVGCGSNNGGPVFPEPLPPVVLEPGNGAAGTQVFIHGVGFLGPSGEWPVVRFHGLRAELLAAREDVAVAVVPAGAWTECQALDVEVSSHDGRFIGRDEFTVTSLVGLFVEIESVSPEAGRPGTPVTLTGRGLVADLGAAEVFFGGVAAEVLEVAWDRVLCVVPEGPEPGAVVPVVLEHELGRSCPGPDFLYR